MADWVGIADLVNDVLVKGGGLSPRTNGARLIGKLCRWVLWCSAPSQQDSHSSSLRVSQSVARLLPG